MISGWEKNDAERGRKPKKCTATACYVIDVVIHKISYLIGAQINVDWS